MTRIHLLASAALVALLAAVLPASAQVPPGGVPAASPGPTEALPGEGEHFTIGDKLRVTFFEEMDLPAGAGVAATSTFYQRVDLTSDYVVGADGRISLPRLGSVLVAGRGADEVRAEIAEAYEAAMGRPGDVHLAITERQPVYVIGPVRAPGAFRYASGMVAIQAIALAGGPERAQERIAPVVEAGRETERSEDARARLTLLLSRRAWLEATSRDAEPAVPDELVRLVGRAGAREMVEAEARAGRAAAVSRERERAGLEERTRAWRDEAAVLSRTLRDLKDEIAARERRIAEATEPDPRLSRNEVITPQRAELVALEARRAETEVQIQRVRQQLAETEAARSRIALDADTSVSRDLVSVTNDIVRLRQTAYSAAELASSIDEGSSPRDADAFAITIVRTANEGVSTMAATPTTKLMPGDVVRLGSAEDAGRSASLGGETPGLAR